MVGHAAFLKGAFKIFRHIIFYTHSGKNNSKFFVGTVSQRGLTHNLCRQLVMGKTVSGENRQLLPSDQCGQPVNGGNACTDIVTGIFSPYRVQGLAIHIRPFLSHDFSQIINRLSDPVKCSSQKAFGKPDFHGMTCETGMGVLQRQVFGLFKHLHHRFILIDFHHTAQLALRQAAVVHGDFHNLIKRSALYAFQYYKRAVHAA